MTLDSWALIADLLELEDQIRQAPRHAEALRVAFEMHGREVTGSVDELPSPNGEAPPVEAMTSPPRVHRISI